jgi:hypothetical protein
MLRHSFEQPGEHEVRARVHLIAADAPADAHAPSVVVESTPLKVRSDGVVMPWMLECARSGSRNLIDAENVAKLTPSSEHNDDKASRAFDGLQSRRWVTKQGDQSPTLIIEFTRPIKADTLVLSQGAAAADEQGRYDLIRSVSVRLNREKEPLQAALQADEARPSAIDLGRVLSISRLEFRVLERVAGKQWAGHVSVCELALEKRR